MSNDEPIVTAGERQMRKYRHELAPEYTKDGKLKPLQRWIGLTPEAKRMAKKLMRHAHAQEQTAIVEIASETMTKAEAHKSMRDRRKAIREHNAEVKQRIKDLSLGATKEQLAARHAKDGNIRPVTEYKPEDGGPFHSTIKTIKDPGYLGVELRAMRSGR